MDLHPDQRTLHTLATHAAGPAQKWFAAAVSAAFAIATAYLLPLAAVPASSGPGFLAINQSLLLAVYGLTTFLLYVQFRRAGSAALLALAAGNLFTTLIVFAQLLTFPNLLVSGRLLGTSPATTTWLWTFWHLGPPVYALAFAWLSASRDHQPERAGCEPLVAWIWSAFAVFAAAIVTWISLYLLAVLPKQVDANGSYWSVTTSGVGPALVVLTVVALTVLCWRTRLKTVLQLWVAIGLFFLILDNLLTLPASARETVGWVGGRVGALLAALAVLGVLLWEVERLYKRAEAVARLRGDESNELRLARDNLSMALEAAEMGDWEMNLATGASRRSLSHDRIFGYDRLLPQWDFEDLYAHVVPEDREMARMAVEGARSKGSFDLVCRVNPADGGPPRWIAERGKTYLDEHGKPKILAGVVMDVTSRHDLDERLAQAQRMEAIGQLTGGVAHDFNNILTVIVGNLDMLSRKSDDSAKVARLSSIAMMAARRGAEMTEKLLAFSRRQALRPETIDANAVVADFVPLLKRAVGESIVVDVEHDLRACCIHVDRTQFEAVLVNLAVNARDAEATLLEIASRPVDLARSDPVLRADMEPGTYIRLSIKDNGAGMDAATIARSVEPFFTTKEIGKGTGLGLSQAYGFARQARGAITIDSAVGIGTTVTIYLPEAGEAAPALYAPKELVSMLRRATNGEVVLVVEDEPAVREMAIESLSDLGYGILSAPNAHQGLSILQSADRIDILFSDVVMPGGMNGVQLCVEARRIRPDLKVVLASGYATGALDGASVPEDVPLIKKPYAREVLASTLRTVLSA